MRPSLSIALKRLRPLGVTVQREKASIADLRVLMRFVEKSAESYDDQ